MEKRLSLATLDTFKDQIVHTDLLTLCRSLPPQSVDMILCDLPYGTTACSWDEVIPFEPMWAGFKRVIKPRGAVVLTATNPFEAKLICSNLDWFRSSWVWDKGKPIGFQLASIRQLMQHEDIIVFGYPSVRYYPQTLKRSKPVYGGTGAPTIHLGNELTCKQANPDLEFPRSILRYKFVSAINLYHPTQKPVALFEYLIRTYTLPGELVLDPCIGSGTTAIACLNLDRHFIGGDITLEYVELARKRLEKHDPTKAHEVAPGVKQLSLFDTVRVL